MRGELRLGEKNDGLFEEKENRLQRFSACSPWHVIAMARVAPRPVHKTQMFS